MIDPVFLGALVFSLFFAAMAILLYHSPSTALRIGCWMVAWGVARKEQKKIHSRQYARMLDENGLHEDRELKGWIGKGSSDAC